MLCVLDRRSHIDKNVIAMMLIDGDDSEPGEGKDGVDSDDHSGNNAADGDDVADPDDSGDSADGNGDDGGG